jgi:hypothetical protein
VGDLDHALRPSYQPRLIAAPSESVSGIVRRLAHEVITWRTSALPRSLRSAPRQQPASSSPPPCFSNLRRHLEASSSQQTTPARWPAPWCCATWSASGQHVVQHVPARVTGDGGCGGGGFSAARAGPPSERTPATPGR